MHFQQLAADRIGAIKGWVISNMDNTDIVQEDMPLREQLFFLNYDSGISYCGDDEEFYVDILRSYLEENVLSALNDLYMKSDWRSYKVKVHALKSSSRYIGADDISDKAKLLEYAAKDNDISYINTNHYKFIWEYEVLLKKINSIFINGSSHEDVAGLGQISVLIIEENTLAGEFFSNIMSRFYHVTLCRSAEEALKRLSRVIPDIILLDINLPTEVDGYLLMRKLKANEKMAGIPVIVMTSDDQPETEMHGFEEGAADFISKNSNPDVVIARINRIVELEYLRKFFYNEIKKRTDEEKEKREKAEKLSEEIVDALFNSIDAKDKNTKAHGKRVADYAVQIAKELGYDEEQLRMIRYAGLLHDIGCIGISDEILNKNGDLTPEELTAYKSHTLIGAGILSSINSISDIAIAAKYHHECYDGSGYPEGLSRLHIPEVARIIGVASAYDKMIFNERMENNGQCRQEVIRQKLADGIGTKFDPLFVQTLIELMERDTDFIK